MWCYPVSTSKGGLTLARALPRRSAPLPVAQAHPWLPGRRTDKRGRRSNRRRAREMAVEDGINSVSGYHNRVTYGSSEFQPPERRPTDYPALPVNLGLSILTSWTGHMPESARDARVKPWQQAAQGLVSVLHVVRPPTRSLCTTTASARHVPQQRHSRAGFSPSGTRSEPPARQHQSSRPIPRTRRRSRRWSRWAAIARSNCTLGACCWPSKCPQPRCLACILTCGTSPGHNQQQRSRLRALVLLHQAQHIFSMW